MQAPSSQAIRKLFDGKGQEAWLELVLTYGKTFRHGRLVATCEPEAARAVLMDKVHTQIRSELHKAMRHIPGADGILFKDGDDWQKRIRALMPVFTKGHLDAFPSYIHETTLAHAERWQTEGRLPDLYTAIEGLGVAIALRVGYGLDPANAGAQELGRALIGYKRQTIIPDERYRLDVFGMGAEKLLQLPWIGLTMVKLASAMRGVERATRALLESRAARAEGLGWLLQLEETGLSPEKIALELNHLYGAYNAIDYTLTCGLYELTGRPTWVAALREELFSVLGERAFPTHEDLDRLPRMNAVLQEVLRLYPVSMGVARRLGAPLELGGERLNAGVEVLVLPYPLQRHPDFWENGNHFLPERWLTSLEPKVPFSFVPFLDGARKCIGQRLAELQFTVVVAALVQRYDLATLRRPQIPPFLVPRFAAPIPTDVRRTA